MGRLLAVLRNRNLGLLLTGRIISSGGDWLYQIALSVAIFQYSGGKSFYVGLLWIIRLIPPLFLAPFAGALADRLGYRQSMIVADVARMFLLIVLAFALHRATWPVIYPLAFGVTSFAALFRPASVGIIPSLVKDKSERLAANAATMQVESIAIVAGSAIGGVVAGAGLINPLLFIDAVTFAFSAGCLWFILPRPIEKKDQPAQPEDLYAGEELGEGLIAGFRSLASRPLLVFSASVMALPELASGANVVWIVPYSIQNLHLGNAGVGYLYAFLGVGSFLGGFTAAAVGGNVRLDRLLAFSVAAGGVVLILFGVIHVAALALVCILGVGLAETMEYASYETLLQQAVPEDSIGRASGTMDSFLFNMMLIGTALSGLLAATIGLTWSIAGLGTLIVIGTVLAWLNLQRVTSGQPTVQTLGEIPAFAGVPTAVREWAVRRMQREQFQKGSVIIRQGDPGERFYTIARGKVEVEVAAEGQNFTRELGRGDFFGEIALLKDVPRTATVRALQRVIVWTMSREDFEALQQQAGSFKDSLWDTATARLESDSTNLKLALSGRM